MHPEPGFSDLAGRRVGVWGLGVEGRATLRALSAVGVSPFVVADDHPVPGESRLTTEALTDLLQCDVVIKSPGISPYRDDVVRVASAGVLVTSALALWMTDASLERVIAVTGTKGKSTTASLVAFLLAACDHSVLLAGNIGVAPYDPLVADECEWVVLEVSSFQAKDLRRCPRYVGLTSLGSDHLDWHGDVETYRRDKISFLHYRDPHVTIVSADPSLTQVPLPGDVMRLNDASPAVRDLARQLELVGDHNVHNLDLALHLVASALNSPLDVIATRASEHHRAFSPLPGRLSVAHRDGPLTFIDDGLATSALPTIAALRVVDGPLVLIAGGFDRGVDYQPLVDELVERGATSLVTIGPAGRRLGLLARDTGLKAHDAADLADAVRIARRLLDRGTVLFSPAAPSFDAYENWAARSADFTRLVRLPADEK